jgi:type II secretory ATPase GspE/PulE/Tfp pilus assembly ATPase PilB-like protein
MMPDQNKITSLQEALKQQKILQTLTNCINIAAGAKDILLEAPPILMDLFQVEAAHLYLRDKNNKEIYTLTRTEGQAPEEKTFFDQQTLPGFIAHTGKMIRITDLSDPEQREIYSECCPKGDEDSRLGLRIRQILAMPIFYGGEILGVIEIINKKGNAPLREKEPALLQDIAEMLGIAFYNDQILDPRAKRTKGDYLVSRGLISKQDMELVLEEARKSKEPFQDILVKKYNLRKEDVGKACEFFWKCKFVSFDKKTPIPGDLLKNLKKEYLTNEVWVPLEKTGKGVRVIMDDPQDILRRDSIEKSMKMKAVQYDVALKEDIIKFIEFFFQEEHAEESFNALMDKIAISDGAQETIEEEEDVQESDSAIIQLVNKIIQDAFARRASDIHIEPDTIDKTVQVRYRIDGDCQLYQTLPYSYRAALISRIKIMSNLDITVKRTPQDGKIKLKHPTAGDIELRVATIPTQGGVEDVVMRILAKGGALPLTAMKLSERNYRELLKICDQPYGIILCVGPTGSGKTTTLHAILNYINKPDRKVWTAEDPVEITQRGLRQVQVQPKIGFDFAAAMRAFLRADPDVIMVGEMRDFETAKIGVEASLTGHLVLSTLHTNSAPETITRFLDMGIDPLNFADSMLGILAQRLVRTLCNQCKEAYHPSREEYDAIAGSFGAVVLEKQNIPYADSLKLYRPKGCEACDQTGYKGRIGIHELLINSDEIRKKVLAHTEGIEAIRNTAMEQGMLTLYQDGILKAFQGLTDIKQVHRVCKQS